MARVTGVYRVDAKARQFFGSERVHLICRGDRVVGRFGRHGAIDGQVEGRAFLARFRSPAGEGWIEATFNERFNAFEGSYGVDSGKALGSVSATKVTRAR